MNVSLRLAHAILVFSEHASKKRAAAADNFIGIMEERSIDYIKVCHSTIHLKASAAPYPS